MLSSRNLNYLLAVVLVAAVVFAYRMGRTPAPAGMPRPLPAANTGPAATPLAQPSPGTAAPSMVSAELTAAGEAIQAQNFEKARDILESIPATDPAYQSALYNLGILYDRLKKPDAAIASLQKLIAIQPDNPDAWASLGWALWSSGQALEAERATLRTLEYQPDNFTARYNLGLYRLALNRTAESIASYERAFRTDGRQTGFPSALHDLRVYSDAHPEHADAKYLLAYFYKVLGEYGLETKTLETYLMTAEQGPFFDAASKRLEQARELGREQGLLVTITPTPTPK